MRNNSSEQKIEIFNIKNVVPGMKVSQDIKDKKGFLLVTANMELSENLIGKLTRFGITEIPVFVSKHETNIPIDNVDLNHVIRSQLLSYINNSLIKFIRDEKHTMRVITLLEDIVKDDLIVSILVELKTIGNNVFSHSLNVALLSLIIAIKNDFPIDRLILVAQASLLHDIGKKFLPVELLQKGNNFTLEEKETFEKHSLFSYEYLQSLNYFGPELLKVILQHHERIDGSGYPEKTTGANIHKVAQIIGIADNFCSIINDDYTNKSNGITEAIEFLECAGAIYFNFEYAISLLEEIYVYHVNDWVVLNNGDIGIVTKVNKLVPLRPTVAVFFDKFRQKYTLPKYIDLTQRSYTQLSVKNILT